MKSGRPDRNSGGGSEGDFKVYGRALEVLDLGRRRGYCDALYQQNGWKPEEPEFHLFSIDLDAVGFVEIKDGGMTHRRWAAGGPSIPGAAVEEIRQP